jgi:hypothetical protein
MPDDAGFSADNGYVGPVWFDAETWDPADIPTRPWLAPGYFLRGAVTTIIGPGGVSKSSLVLAYVVALALNKKLHLMHPRGAFRSLVFNVEDDRHEQQRRLTAILGSLGKLPSAIAGMVVRSGPKEVGVLFELNPETGEVEPTPAMALLEDAIQDHAIDVLFVDPLAELHNEEENDNGAMRSIVAAFRVLAVRRNIAVVIIHHTRKGVTVAGDADAGRGASSVVGASRVVLTLTGMSPEEAKAFGVGEDARKLHFRVDGGKANYSSLTGCEWFERITSVLPNEDTVAVPVPWTPPVDSVSPEMREQVEAAIRRGSDTGPWSMKLENRPRSIKHAMVEAGIITAPGQRDLLQALMRDGFTSERWLDPNRKWVGGLQSPDGKPDNVTWWSPEDGEP